MTRNPDWSHIFSGVETAMSASKTTRLGTRMGGKKKSLRLSRSRVTLAYLENSAPERVLGMQMIGHSGWMKVEILVSSSLRRFGL